MPKCLGEFAFSRIASPLTASTERQLKSQLRRIDVNDCEKCTCHALEPAQAGIDGPWAIADGRLGLAGLLG